MAETTSTSTATGAERPIVPYRALWAVLLLGWVVSYADRTVTGPVIAWMIQNNAGFIGDAANPATLGGLVGTMFFTGYMLTQYAGGRLGDQYGHREMIVVSLLWAGVMTAVSGLVAGLIAFVAARVLTGLGEGVFYSNDRTLIFNHTPDATPHHRSGDRDRRSVHRSDRRHRRDPVPDRLGRRPGHG